MVETVNKKNVPTSVKVISILYYIASAFLIGFSIFLIIFSFSFQVFKDDVTNPITQVVLQGMGFLAGSVLIMMSLFMSVIMILLGAFCIIIGRGIWRGRNWARITVLILSVLFTLSSLSGLANGENPIVGLIVNGLVIYYLQFHKETKSYFLKNR